MKMLNQLTQYFLHPHPLLQKAIQPSLLITSIIILVYCKEISKYFSYGDRDLWFYYFTMTERIAMFSLFLSVFKYIKTISWIIGELIFCFLTQDILDRLFFNIREININDYITISLLIAIALIKYINKNGNNTRKNRRTKLF